MNSLEELKRNWEGLAQADPFWAICTDPLRKNGGWKPEEFFASGEHEINCAFRCLSELQIRVDQNSAALDFGCGVGRLTRALATRFIHCRGVDISPTMIRVAQQLNRELVNCEFVVNDQPGLPALSDSSFGFIYSSIVLQHIPPPYSAEYLTALVHLLRPGGVLVFQLLDQFRAPVFKRLRRQLALRRRARKLFFAGANGDSMDLYLFGEARVRELLGSVKAKVIDVRFTNSADPAFNGRLQYLETAPEQGYVSKQYVVTKTGSAEQTR